MLGCAIVSAGLVARWLGPADKGTLSALLLIAHGFMLYALSFGLGEATVVHVRNRQLPLERAVSASMPLLFVSSLLGPIALLVVAAVADWRPITSAVWIAGLGLVLWIYFDFFVGVLNSQGRVPFTSAARAVVGVVSAISTIVLVGLLEMGIFGGALAVAIALLAGLAFMTPSLAALGIDLRPSLDRAYLSSALRYGIPTQASFLMMAVVERFDFLLVYALAGEVAGGQYSISLTIAWLITHLPGSLVMAAFPRLAGIDEQQARALVIQMMRLTIISSVMVGAVLILLVPWGIPLILGDAYRPSVAPSLVLLVGRFAWSECWILARASSARGDPTILLRSLAVNMSVMLPLDLLLIPKFGAMGAALASVAGSLVGLAACWHWARKFHAPVREFIPRSQDFRQLRLSLRQFIPGFSPRSVRK